MITLEKNITKILENFVKTSKPITILSGAGISAESNIPTFRGPEGFWTIGSKEYHPQEMATYRMFKLKPWEVWKWYLYRLDICRKAEPNPGHTTISEMEKYFGNRFTLITQNVDNLHLRAGNSLNRTYQIHGNIFFPVANKNVPAEFILSLKISKAKQMEKICLNLTAICLYARIAAAHSVPMYYGLTRHIMSNITITSVQWKLLKKLNY